MPLYQYRCADCGHELEVLQKLSDPAPVECPVCHHASLQKQVTAAGFQLKGTGWYVTDFRGGNSAAARADKPAESGSAATSETPATPATPAAVPAATPAASAPTGATPAAGKDSSAG